MGLQKQARMLSPDEIVRVEKWISKTRHDATRDLVIFYLSVYAGLRSKEIAGLTWEMVDRERDGCLRLTNRVSKGAAGGRVVPIHPKLMAALEALRGSYNVAPRHGNVVLSRAGSPFSAKAIVQKFGYWYQLLDMDGCSSHSGRRTFITTAARSISLHGGSLRDVQSLAATRR